MYSLRKLANSVLYYLTVLVAVGVITFVGTYLWAMVSK